VPPVQQVDPLKVRSIVALAWNGQQESIVKVVTNAVSVGAQRIIISKKLRLLQRIIKEALLEQVK